MQPRIFVVKRKASRGTNVYCSSSDTSDTSGNRRNKCRSRSNSSDSSGDGSGDTSSRVKGTSATHSLINNAMIHAVKRILDAFDANNRSIVFDGQSQHGSNE